MLQCFWPGICFQPHAKFHERSTPDLLPFWILLATIASRRGMLRRPARSDSCLIAFQRHGCPRNQ